MNYIFPSGLLLAFLLVLVGPAQAQDTTQLSVQLLPAVSPAQNRIDNLQAAVPYASLRRGRYGWVYPGRWEVGLHLMPWFASDGNFARILSDEESGSRGSTTIDLGEAGSRTFFNKRNEFFAVGGRPGVVFLNVGIARQFSNGWRLGVGYTLYNVVSTRPLRVDEVVGVVDAGEYALLSSASQRQRFLSAEAGFTFRKRRRFRPALSLSAVWAGNSVTKGSTLVIDGNDDSVIIERERISRRPNTFRSVYFLARLGLQYQLTLNATLGLEVGMPVNAGSYVGIPLIGIGGRYCFAREL